MSFRDVTIKITDRGWDKGCDWRHAPEAWAEVWEKSVSWDFRPGRGQTNLYATGAARDGGEDGKVSIERWYLSPYVVKPFNSKVIKSFVPELRSRKCFVFFCVSAFLFFMYICYEHSMNISRIHVWLCNTMSLNIVMKKMLFRCGAFVENKDDYFFEGNIHINLT